MDVFDIVKLDPVNYYILYSLKELKAIKAKISSKELKEFQDIFQPYEVLYEKEKRSVVEKKIFLKGIDKKDYVSLATYFWPNKETADGLPYVSYDGKANPEGDLYDKQNLRRLAFITYFQAILYFLSEDEKYLRMIEKNWTYYFFDDITGMNPNMDHAQLIRGVNLGRGIGMIDFTANVSYALYMLNLLKKEKKLSESFLTKLIAWLEKFYHWYQYSRIALEEKYAENNHGIFYDFGLCVLIDFLEKKDEMYPLVIQMIELRMKHQIKKDRMPLELQRTKAKSYALMGIKGIYDFSFISSSYGYNLYTLNEWYDKKADIDIRLVEDLLYRQLVSQEVTFPYEQITPFDVATLLPLIYEKNKWDVNSLKNMIKLKCLMKMDWQYRLLKHL